MNLQQRLARLEAMGEWKICQSSYQVNSTQILEFDEGFARAVFAGGRAPAELDDPSAQAGGAD